MIKVGLALGIVSIGFLWIQQGLTFPTVEEAGTDVAHRHHHKRLLTPQETELANAARAQIARVLEKNLIRLFAAVTVEEQRRARRLGRQAEEEEEEDPAETATFNPNTLPQVAALLGSIFSGNLNLTNVVDRAFYLVPDAVRSQVTGLFKLLGGNGLAQPGTGSTAATAAPAYVPHPLDTTPAETTNSTAGNDVFAEPELEETTTARTIEPDAAAFGSVFEVKSTSPAPPGVVKKQVADSGPVLPVAESISYDDDFSDDELKKAEETIVEHAKAYEPFVKDKEPRYFLGPLQQMFRSDSLNFTSIFRAMPDLFKGARQAFVLLEQLGEIVTGDDK